MLLCSLQPLRAVATGRAVASTVVVAMVRCGCQSMLRLAPPAMKMTHVNVMVTQCPLLGCVASTALWMQQVLVANAIQGRLVGGLPGLRVGGGDPVLDAALDDQRLQTLETGNRATSGDSAEWLQ